MIESVKVGAHRYAILRDSVVLTDECDWAQHDGRRRAIHVETRERPDSAIAEDLLHEVLHAAFLDSGLEIERDDEERICTTLGPRLAAFLADNPEQVRELLDMLAAK